MDQQQLQAKDSGGFTLFIIIMLSLLGLLGFSFIFWIIDYTFSSKLLAFICITLILRYIGIAICRFLTFPGYVNLFRKFNEHAMAKILANVVRRNVRYLSFFLDWISSLNQGNQIQGQVDADQLLSLSIWIQYQIDLFQLIHDRHNITNEQLEIDKLLKETQVIIKGTPVNLHTMMRQPALVYQAFESLNLQQPRLIKDIQQRIGAIELLLENYNTKELSKRYQKILKFELLGTINLKRAIIEKTHQYTQRPIFRSRDGYRLDCMFISCDNDNFQVHPTMLICNPNAACYESLYHDTNLPEFYIRLGINVMLWNYRGFGESEGTPDPIKIMQDGEDLIDLMRWQLKCQKIGVHGYSLGGMVACHIASKKNLDFLLADRTFSSLSAVVQYGFGSPLNLLFRLLTNWNHQVNQDFIKFTGDKCIATDPNDEIISFQSSLAQGVAESQFLQDHDVKKFIHKSSKLKKQVGFLTTIAQRHKCGFIEYLLEQQQQFTDGFFNTYCSKSDFLAMECSLLSVMSILNMLYQEDPEIFDKAPQNLKINKIDENNDYTDQTKFDLLTSGSYEKFAKEVIQEIDQKKAISALIYKIYYIFSDFSNGCQDFIDIFMKQNRDFLDYNRIKDFKEKNKKSKYNTVFDNQLEESLIKFFIFGQVWGRDLEGGQNFKNQLGIFMNDLETLVARFSSNNDQLIKQISSDLSIITQKIASIHFYSPRSNSGEILDNIIFDAFDNQDQIIKTNNESNSAVGLGKLIILRCGHNGTFRESELESYKQFVIQSSLLKQIN